MNRAEALAELRQITLGIAHEEGDAACDGEGWWETSAGASFGALRLAELERLLERVTEPGLASGRPNPTSSTP